MMRKICVSVVAMAWAAVASADIYKCTDGEGHVTYSNVQGKGCTRLISASAAESSNTMAPPPPSTRGKGAAANPSPADFPKVDGSTQRARDDDRRRILENELQSEQKALEEAKKALTEQEAIVLPEEMNQAKNAAGKSFAMINNVKKDERLKGYRDKIALHERNIEALKKELGNLK